MSALTTINEPSQTSPFTRTAIDREVLVRVENVSKKFCRSLKKSLWYGVKDITRELNPFRHNTSTNGVQASPNDYSSSLRDDEFWAVNDVSFELRRGECLGLIGHNGAGKTTLLKMLNGLIKPDAGRIEMRGRVGALIALGAGFNPILTGRENIYVNGAVLGFSKREIDDRLDQIIDFSELTDFIDSPVQSYSSGMQVRLGFAVAVHLDPDILLVDEVLAVGDVGFKMKCYNAINEIIGRAAVILVSHSMPQVGKVCRSGIVMHRGRIELSSQNIGEAIACYYNKFGHETMSVEGSGGAQIRSIRLINAGQTFLMRDPASATESSILDVDVREPLICDLEFTLAETISAYSILISIADADQKLVSQAVSGPKPINKKRIEQVARVRFSSLLLNTGKYTISFHISDGGREGWTEVLLGLRSAICISIQREIFYGSAPLLYEAHWESA